MELADYNIMSVHIEGNHNILTDAISRLKTLNICEEPLENSKAQVLCNAQQISVEVCATSMYTTSIDILCNEQKQDKMCKN